MYTVRDKINVKERKYCFEIFGYDILIDDEFNPYLIEINSNPGIDESSPLINIIIPRMIDDAMKLTIDDIFKEYYSEPYKTIYEVDGYSNEENLWEMICNLNEKFKLN